MLLWVGSGLRLSRKRLDWHEHSSLLRTFVNCERKKFYEIGIRLSISDVKSFILLAPGGSSETAKSTRPGFHLIERVFLFVTKLECLSREY